MGAGVPGRQSSAVWKIGQSSLCRLVLSSLDIIEKGVVWRGMAGVKGRDGSSREAGPLIAL